jgi:Protein of unknown function (DUF2934)
MTTDAEQHEAALKEKIRDTAYRLWEEDGRPDGRSDEYWHRARQLLHLGEGKIDLQSGHSLPASDAPAHTGVTGPGAPGQA